MAQAHPPNDLDTFLPSGAIEAGTARSGLLQSHSSSMVSPQTCPHQDYSDITSPHIHGIASLSESSLPRQRFDIGANSYDTIKELRQQIVGERAFWKANSMHIQDQMNEERMRWTEEREQLEAQSQHDYEFIQTQMARWEKERKELQSEIQMLKEQLKSLSGVPSPNGALALRKRGVSSETYSSTVGSRLSPAGASSRHSSLQNIPQESGRNPDGTPFYAPAPLNPSRTFSQSENDNLRVNSITLTQDTPLIVTSRNLTKADFEPNSSSTTAVNHSEDAPFDISEIASDLEGVPIKATAVASSFVNKVRSASQASPLQVGTMNGPEILNSHKSKHNTIVDEDLRNDNNDYTSPAQQGQNVFHQPAAIEHESSAKAQHTIGTPPSITENLPTQNDNTRPSLNTITGSLSVIAQPEARRLTMHAGHTPSHSISLTNVHVDSGNKTPTVTHSDNIQVEEEVIVDDTPDEDPALTGPLTLTNSTADEYFLAELDSKLSRVASSAALRGDEADQEDNATAEEHLELQASREDHNDGEDDEYGPAPVPRLKQSLNFGVPFGRKD